MASEKLTVAKVTKAQIEEWKSKYAKLRQISVPKDEENPDGDQADFIIRNPTRAEVNAIAKYHNEGKLDKAQNVMIKSCILAGDMDALEVDDIYYTVLDQISELLEKKKATVKKL